MPFVKRDAEGQIVGVFSHASDVDLEEVPVNDPDLGQFLERAHLAQRAGDDWIESDLSMARVLEDLIGVLIDKNVIQFTDLPKSARQKILERQGMRRELAYVESLFPVGVNPLVQDNPAKPLEANYL